MTAQAEELIKEIAVRHGVGLSRDDPILILQTLNNFLMKENTKVLDSQLQSFKEELEGVAQRWGTEATTKSERILNASLAASTNVMNQNLQANAKAMAEGVREEITSELARFSASIQDSNRIAMFNIGAAGIALVAAMVALWATLG